MRALSCGARGSQCRVMAPSPTAVFFAGGEAMLLTPFRAGAAHVVQLGAIGIKNPRRPFRERRAETVPISRAKVPMSDNSVEIAAPGTIIWRLFPPAVLAEGNLDALGFPLL
jgi:hypothetical protein